MVAAAVLAVGLRHTRWTPSPLSGGEPLGERLAVTVGRAGGMLIGAYVGGLLTIGAGGRLMMRVLAATSSDGVQGLRTEAEEVIGEVSVGGTVFLIVGVGIGAAVLGLAPYAVLRRWLPDRSVAAGLIGVAIGGGLLVRPVGLLSSANRDFTLLAPVALAVAFCLVMLALFGATFGVLVDHLASRWPRPGWSVRGVVAVLPFAVLLAVPPFFVAAVAGVLAGAVAPRLRSSAMRDQPEPRDVDRAGARLGRRVIMALGGVGTLSIVLAAGQVLAV